MASVSFLNQEETSHWFFYKLLTFLVTNNVVTK